MSIKYNMSDYEILDILSNIKGRRTGGLASKHQVLTVLYTLGHYWHGEERMVYFNRVYKELNKLINLFSPMNKKKDLAAYFPFWHLQFNKPKIWNLYGVETLKKSTDGRPLMSSIRESEYYRGGLIKSIHQRVVHDKYFLMNLIFTILNKNFPKSIHILILEKIGIPSLEFITEPTQRELFNTLVLANYNFSCVACRIQESIKSDDILAVEASHIKWPLAGGPHDVDNGIVLCPQHKRLFDHGAFSLNDKNEFIVSKSSVINNNDPLLNKLHNKNMPNPEELLYIPNKEYINWHNTAVFK